MYDRLESGFGGWADEKMAIAREAAPQVEPEKSHPEHLTIAPFALRTSSLPPSKEGGQGDCPPQADANKTIPYEQKVPSVRR
jgi:hypothetical protein